MGLEEKRDDRGLTSKQVKDYKESREQFRHQISNDHVRGKSKPEWGFEDEQMAKIQTHAIFEKHLREELKTQGVQMSEDDLQKIISIDSPLLRIIGERIERKSDNPLSFSRTAIFDDPNKSRMIYGEGAQELAKQYPMEASQKAAKEAMEKTVNGI